MALDAANVRVGITGGVRSAAVGTTAPTDPTSAYGAGWNEYGYISEDGVEETFTSESTDIRAWQNGVLVRTVNSRPMPCSSSWSSRPTRPFSPTSVPGLRSLLRAALPPRP